MPRKDSKKATAQKDTAPNPATGSVADVGATEPSLFVDFPILEEQKKALQQIWPDLSPAIVEIMSTMAKNYADCSLVCEQYQNVCGSQENELTKKEQEIEKLNAKYASFVVNAHTLLDEYDHIYETSDTYKRMHFSSGTERGATLKQTSDSSNGEQEKSVTQAETIRTLFDEEYEKITNAEDDKKIENQIKPQNRRKTLLYHRL